jgi:hypothetical protein
MAGRIGHGAVDVAAEHGEREVAGALVRHVGRLDRERLVHALVCRVVGRVQARAAEVDLARVGLSRLDEVGPGLDRALLADDEDVGRVVEPEHRRHVLGLVRDVAFHRLQHHVRQVDADDVDAVGGQRVGLAPEQGAAGAGLVLDHGVDRRALLLQHHLLVARRQVGLAALAGRPASRADCLWGGGGGGLGQPGAPGTPRVASLIGSSLSLTGHRGLRLVPAERHGDRRAGRAGTRNGAQSAAGPDARNGAQPLRDDARPKSTLLQPGAATACGRLPFCRSRGRGGIAASPC